MELHGKWIPLFPAVPRAVWVVQTAVRSQIRGSLKDVCDDVGAVCQAAVNPKPHGMVQRWPTYHSCLKYAQDLKIHQRVYPRNEAGEMLFLDCDSMCWQCFMCYKIRRGFKIPFLPPMPFQTPQETIIARWSESTFPHNSRVSKWEMNCINQVMAGEQPLHLFPSCLLQKIIQGLPGQQVITELLVHGGISSGGWFVCGLGDVLGSWAETETQEQCTQELSSHSESQRQISDLPFLVDKALWAWKQPLENNMVLHSSLSKLILYFFTSFLLSLANQISWCLYSTSKHCMKYYFSQVSDLT